MFDRTTAFAALAALACCLGLTGLQADDKGGADKTLTDAEFVRKAAQTNIAEVKLGKLAAERASNPKVKQFAQLMVEDHSKAQRELAQIAEQKQLTVSTELENKHQMVADKLGRLSGDEFDREYAKTMAKGHKEAVELYEAQSRHGKDAELRAFAAKTLPTVQKHLEMAQNLANQLKGGSER